MVQKEVQEQVWLKIQLTTNNVTIIPNAFVIKLNSSKDKKIKIKYLHTKMEKKK